MATLESLKRRLDSSRQLDNVVKTMKTIAAASIHQFERSADAIEEYHQTVEAGLQIALQHDSSFRPVPADRDARERRQFLAIIIGSSQGMCGQFNEDIVDFAADDLSGVPGKVQQVDVIAVGERTVPLLADRDLGPTEESGLPYSVKGITRAVQYVLSIIDEVVPSFEAATIQLYHSRKKSGAAYEQVKTTLVPLDPNWIKGLIEREWPSKVIPGFRMKRDVLFSGLVRHYIFGSLYQAFAESLAAENASRLAAMQAAESHIEDHLEELESLYNHLRQDSITSELLDIASGYEALKQEGD